MEFINEWLNVIMIVIIFSCFFFVVFTCGGFPQFKGKTNREVVDELLAERKKC